MPGASRRIVVDSGSFILPFYAGDAHNDALLDNEVCHQPKQAEIQGGQ
jgi:hypothetical protein